MNTGDIIFLTLTVAGTVVWLLDGVGIFDKYKYSAASSIPEEQQKAVFGGSRRRKTSKTRKTRKNI